MKAAVTSKITINSSVEDTFKYLSDLKYHVLWNPQMRYISSTKPLKLNTTYETTNQVLGVTIKSKNVVTRFSENKELQIENTTGTVQYVANFKINSIKKHQQVVSCTTIVSSDHKAFAFQAPVLKVLARHELQSDLRSLKVAVEHKLTV